MAGYELARGDICLVDFGNPRGRIQGGLRPAVIVQNNIGNHFSTTTIVVPVTSKLGKAHLPTHVKIPVGEGGIKSDSLALTEQIQTINKDQISRKIGSLSSPVLTDVDDAIRVSLGQ